jgi:ATP-dependent DNA ligase
VLRRQEDQTSRCLLVRVAWPGQSQSDLRLRALCAAHELWAEAEDDAKFVVAGTASAYLLRTMKINPLPTGFIIPAQPVKASKPPVGTDWVHEIKHNGYRIIVRRDGPAVRLYSRNAYDLDGATGGDRGCRGAD